MMAGSDCDCLICRLEASLIDDLSHEERLEEYRLWAASSEILSAFPTASELIGHLHRQNENQTSPVDEVIAELVRAGANGRLEPIAQSILLLVFVPTIHRTTTQISAAFPLLGREDTAQHLFAASTGIPRFRRTPRAPIAPGVLRRAKDAPQRLSLGDPGISPGPIE